jgi:cardiolipin synthase
MMLKHLPNTISIARIILVWPVVECLLSEQYVWAWWLFLIAGVSDGVDGYLARRFGWRSELGAMLDPIGDKLLMVSSYLVLGWMKMLPLWLVGLVIARDVIIVIGTMIYQRITNDKTITPLYISKVNTVMQILLVVVVLFGLAFWSLSAWITQLLIVVVTITTIASGAGYVIGWTRRARQAVKEG